MTSQAQPHDNQQRQPEQLGDRQQILNGLARLDSGRVNRRQNEHRNGRQQDGVLRSTPPKLGAHVLRVIGKHVGHRPDAAAENTCELSPPEQETDQRPERLGEEHVIAAASFVHRREFGVTESSDQAQPRAKRPGNQPGRNRPGSTKDDRRRFENCGTHHDSDDDTDGVPDGKRGGSFCCGCFEWRRFAHRILGVIVADAKLTRFAANPSARRIAPAR